MSYLTSLLSGTGTLLPADCEKAKKLVELISYAIDIPYQYKEYALRKSRVEVSLLTLD